ncbi:hypothetical protein HG531_001832 [Fusarium graminearum]|nr:hypothetical protein HG531_001832 [Fusarium graminearum]
MLLPFLTLEVVGASSAVVHVKSALALVIARSEDFVNVDLTTAGLPAAALAVLAGAGNTAVEGPEGGHVAVEAGVAVERHLELEEEDLVGTGEALCLVSCQSIVHSLVKDARALTTIVAQEHDVVSNSLLGVVVGGDNLSVNSSGDPFRAFLLALFMEMAMTMEVRRGRTLSVTLVLARTEVVNGEFFELERATDMNR